MRKHPYFIFTIALVIMTAWNLPAFALDGAVVNTVLKPTRPGSPVNGTASFEEAPDGLMIRIEVAGARPGLHGIHIHEKGACGDQGNAAGGHFNPDASDHGDVVKNGILKAHAGDLGNIEILSDGTGKLLKTVPGLTLAKGKRAVAGHALVLHEKEDDFGQPTGNAGGRIACGVI